MPTPITNWSSLSLYTDKIVYLPCTVLSLSHSQAFLQTTDGQQVTLNLCNQSKCPQSGPALALVKVGADGSLTEIDCTPMPGKFDPQIMNRVVQVCRAKPALFGW